MVRQISPNLQSKKHLYPTRLIFCLVLDNKSIELKNPKTFQLMQLQGFQQRNILF
jgi:hypothetical protein